MPRYSINFGKRFLSALIRLAAIEETTKAGILRNAMSLYIYVSDELRDPNKKLIIRTPGEPDQVLILPCRDRV